MADISAELAAIKSAVYGEEVRDSIRDGLQKMNTQLNTAIGTQVVDRETVDAILSSEALSLKYSNYTEVASAVTDLNVLAGTAANYWIPYAKATALNNMPVGHAGRLYVFPAKGSGTNDDGGIQLFISSQYEALAEVWIRGWKGSTWTVWRKLITDDVTTGINKMMSDALLSYLETPTIAVGRYGVSGGVNGNILWCARTDGHKQFSSNVKSIKVECTGYYVRLLLYTSSTNTSTPVWYSDSYYPDFILAPVTGNATYYAVNIRKTSNGEDALTAAELADISSKIKVYVDGRIDSLETTVDSLNTAIEDEESQRILSDAKLLNTIISSFEQVENVNIVVGRYGTSGGVNGNILWCSRTTEKYPISINADYIMVMCDGYEIRILQYLTDSTSASNVPVAYNSAFEKQAAIMQVANGAKYVALNIRKNDDDTYVLTEADLSDIRSKLLIAFNTFVDNSLPESISFNKKSTNDFSNYFYCKEYNSEMIMDFGETTRSTQGMCGDGKRYLWVTGLYNNSDTSNCAIYKIDVLEKQIVKTVIEREYGHANDMAYVPDTNEIHIVSWVTDDTVLYSNGGTMDRVCVIDADTLLFKRAYGLNPIIGSGAGYSRLSSLSYNSRLRQFCGLLSVHTVNSVDVRSLCRWTINGEYVDHVDGIRTGTASGMDYDNNYIYQFLGYRLYYYDLMYNEVGGTTYRLPEHWTTSTDTQVQEAESISVFSDAIYINANNLHDPESNPKIRIYKMTPKVVQHISLRDALSMRNKRLRTGDYEFFSVNVSRPLSFGDTAISSSLENVECVLRLPATYSATDTPTRLVLACHGSSGYIRASSTTWYNSYWKEFMDALLSAGYAVFDANVLPTSTGTDQMGFTVGSPLYVDVLKKAYNYIQENYNVYPQIFVHGTSMGGVGASAFVNAYPSLVLAESSFAGRDVTQYIADVANGEYDEDVTLAKAWGYETTAALKADKWSHIVGAAPSLSLRKYSNGYTLFPPDRETDFTSWLDYYKEVQNHARADAIGEYTAVRTVPYKAWDSWGDNVKKTKAKLILKKAFTNGCSSPYEVVIYETANHTELSYGQIDNMRNQLISWYKRWE